MKVTGAEVWSMLLADPEVTAQLPEGSQIREAFRPFVEASPVVLANLVDERMTFQVLVNAKIKFFRYCLNNGYVDKMAAASGMGDGGMFGGMFADLLEGVVEMLEDMASDIPVILQEQNVTEEQVMLSPQVGLNAANKKLYQAGTLTVADVLRMQPAVILHNNN